MKACDERIHQELKRHGLNRRADNRKLGKNFGLHLTLDGYFCDAKKLNDFALVARSLAELPVRMRMHLLCPPYVVEAAENNTKDPGGFSGFVMIQESHISVHTFPRRRFVSIDVYSCQNFDTAPVIHYFRKVFGIRKVETNIVIRGTEYPHANIA